MRFWNYLPFFKVLFGASIDSEVIVKSSSQIIKYIEEHLPQYGVLKDSNGFVYLDLDDAYIRKLISYIEQYGFEEPPYFGTPDLVGAHISVIYPEELVDQEAKKIKELGNNISFTSLECQIVHPPKWGGIEEIYLVVIEAKELSKIRESYGLPVQNFPFHITIGIKPKSVEGKSF